MLDRIADWFLLHRTPWPLRYLAARRFIRRIPANPAQEETY